MCGVQGVSKSQTQLSNLTGLKLKHESSQCLICNQGPTLTSIHDNWKTTAFNGKTFMGKLMSLLFNMLPLFSSVQSLSRVRLFEIP